VRTFRAILVALAIMATAAPASSASYEPKLETAMDFLETCPASSANHSMEEISRFSFCMGFVRGVLTSTGKEKSVCMPKRVSLFEAVDVVKAWVKT